MTGTTTLLVTSHTTIADGHHDGKSSAWMFKSWLPAGAIAAAMVATSFGGYVEFRRRSGAAGCRVEAPPQPARRPAHRTGADRAPGSLASARHGGHHAGPTIRDGDSPNVAEHRTDSPPHRSKGHRMGAGPSARVDGRARRPVLLPFPWTVCRFIPLGFTFAVAVVLLITIGAWQVRAIADFAPPPASRDRVPRRDGAAVHPAVRRHVLRHGHPGPVELQCRRPHTRGRPSTSP